MHVVACVHENSMLCYGLWRDPAGAARARARGGGARRPRVLSYYSCNKFRILVGT
eukprot:SAG31_NODE_367_length_16811_cov_20.811584_18_plen_55_part_00